MTVCSRTFHSCGDSKFMIVNLWLHWQLTPHSWLADGGPKWSATAPFGSHSSADAPGREPHSAARTSSSFTPLMHLLNYSNGYGHTLTFRIIGSKRFLPLRCSRKCQSALAYSFIERYSCPWLLPRRPPLPAHRATSFKEGYHNDYEKWLLKQNHVTRRLSIKGSLSE